MPHDETNGNGGAMTVRPQQVGVSAEQQRAVAEIQAALTVAAARPRDEIACVDRIKNACQRIGLAECAEYVYNRGGTDITGPTIDLLTVIANCWGNIQFGFRELTQGNGESTVEAFSWDLESNSKRTVVFTVPHKRVTDKGRKVTILTDPRDIYETVANNAQRRVRACLEATIPPDVVGDAVTECRATLNAKAEVTPDAITKLVAAFAKFDVTKEQMETRLGRRIDAMQPAQLVGLRRIWKSITDGMSKAGDWFKAEEGAEQEPQTAADAAKAALKAKAAKEPQADETSQLDPLEGICDRFASFDNRADAKRLYDELCGPDPVVDLSDAQRSLVTGWWEDAQKRLEPAKGKAQKTMAGAT